MQIQKNTTAATKILLILLAMILLAGLLAYFLPTDNGVADAAVLKQGSSGATVKTMQTKLINWGYLTGKADGIFGSKTKAAVIKFQRNNGLTADGIVGTKTAQAMGLKLSGSSSSNNTSGGGNSSSLTCLRELCTERREANPIQVRLRLRQSCSTESEARPSPIPLQALFISREPSTACLTDR